jgi:NadR type nicotinamide-nucleotide adenylyltransferase
MAAIPRARVTVVVTGSECTGKSTLAAQLAARFDAPCSPEFVRGYLDRKAAPLDATDVEPIARGQIAAEDAAAGSAGGLLVKDTDLFSTVIYARHYYGSCPPWITAAAQARLGDLYLLLHPDVPWMPDGQRDRPGQRAEMHALFRDTLAAAGARVADVRGSWAERLATAVDAVSRLVDG